MSHPRPLRVLRQFIATDKLFGVDAVPLGNETPQLAPAATSPATAAPDPAAATASAPPAPAPPSHPATPSTPQPSSRNAAADMPRKKPAAASAADTTSGPSFADASATALAPDAVPTTGPASSLSRDEKISILQQLDATQVTGCTKCDLCRSRTQTVFGEGDPDAKIMFIGEGPGQNEDDTGRPFVGRAGDLLNKMIQAIGYRREDVYIANIVKCRPPNNRTPSRSEVNICSPYLLTQIRTISPRALVTLGGPASQLLLDPAIRITKVRGTWHQFTPAPDSPAIPVMPTFHPAYLLRQYTVANRRKVWDDLKKVVDLVADE